VLVARDLGSVRGVHDLVEFAGHDAQLGAHRLDRLGAARAGRLGLGPLLRRERQGRLGRGHREAGARGHRAGDRRLGGPLLAPDRGPLPGGPLGGGGSGERVGPAADRAQPLLDGAHLKPGFHLGIALRRGPLG
jgi:hypothetical protein